MKIFSVEGNIGSGKSTLVEFVKESRHNFVYLPEPVSLWNEFKDSSGVTILEKYYQNPMKYAFSFQMMAYITRLTLLKNTIKSSRPDSIIITERSIYTDREIFAKMLYDSKHIEEIEYSIYLRWFNELSDIKLDGIIYFETSPEICLKRIEKRNRKGEESIPLNYLKDCHDYHEEWIKRTDVPVLYLDGHPEQSEILIEQINEFVKNS